VKKMVQEAVRALARKSRRCLSLQYLFNYDATLRRVSAGLGFLRHF